MTANVRHFVLNAAWVLSLIISGALPAYPEEPMACRFYAVAVSWAEQEVESPVLSIECQQGSTCNTSEDLQKTAWPNGTIAAIRYWLAETPELVSYWKGIALVSEGDGVRVSLHGLLEDQGADLGLWLEPTLALSGPQAMIELIDTEQHTMLVKFEEQAETEISLTGGHVHFGAWDGKDGDEVYATLSVALDTADMEGEENVWMAVSRIGLGILDGFIWLDFDKPMDGERGFRQLVETLDEEDVIPGVAKGNFSAAPARMTGYSVSPGLEPGVFMERLSFESERLEWHGE
jgi:hypothetical protein